MIAQRETLDFLNNSGLPALMNHFQRALLLNATKSLLPSEESSSLEESDLATLFHAVGPAAAYSCMEQCIPDAVSRGKFQGLQSSFTNNHLSNLRLIQNSPIEEVNDFTSVARQFLLPRYAYLDFDTVTDPRHQIDLECGYPKFITPIMYRYMYDRDDVTRRVVDFFPDECWAAELDVYETDDLEVNTEFEEDWQMLKEDYNIEQVLHRMDRLMGIGHYGALLFGVDDGQDLEQPIQEEDLLRGVRRSVSKKERQLLFLRPFDEYLSFIHMYETDIMSPRYGKPKFYNLVFLDMTIDAAGASIGTRLNRRVHWTRVIHCTDVMQASLTFAIPRAQPVWNRLLDLRKIKGGSAEMFWKGAFPGIAFEIDPRFIADDPEFDREKFKRSIENYSNGLQRYLDLVGIKANSLAPNISDPEKHVRIQMEAIASHNGIPYRYFMGSEEGRLASSQDKISMNQRLARRNRMVTNPFVVRNFIDRMIAIGVMRPPRSGRYFVDWSDFNNTTDEDKANLALKWTQALSQYVSSGVIHFMNPVDYMTMVMGLKPRDALRINQYIMSQGGFTKLKSVDPSQGSGQNGVRENNVSKGDQNGKSGEKPAKRDSGDKQTEGMKG